MSSKFWSALIVTFMAGIIFVGGYVLGYRDGVSDAVDEFRQEIKNAEKLHHR